ncbi:hypothetical protein PACTADRAFT_46901 [Pachysolen tannophilus NRRL Y-2460]|uniref:1,3-beta-glucanosyltransferase n=1 Tax=Pachysolen tannophilus NRRL Y-2460 TaxID=669874 RepID=A0A1E4TNQ4_PACTA|nr:hypothetical protein PACTADRAFT_46901 [Pachysolen tannophilus NRRL Y-2460]
MKVLQLVQALLATSVLAVQAVPIINVTGNAFFDSESGDRFYIRGVDYQPGGSSNLSDPLADETTCERDIPVFTDLGINTIRVYSVDNSKNHDACMKLLEEAEIYVILDVNTPDAAISRTCPSGSYNAEYLQNVFATIDSFQNFTNVLGFFAGNEVINSVNTTDAAPYVKAVVRDMKNYMDARSYRAIPVGYSSADIASIRLDIAEYFNCGNDSTARIDFLGVNDYSWCGYSSFTTSGYAEKVELYSGYSIPIFLSEFGCNEVTGSRPFTEVGAIYSTEMSSVFSGGLVYEYSEESNDYGLVDIVSSTNVTKLTDFYNLKDEFEETDDPSGDGGYSDSYNYSTCPDWDVTTTLPSMPEGAEKYLTSGAGTGEGFEASTEYCDSEDDEETSDSSSSSTSKTASATASAAASSSVSSSSSSSSSSSAAGVTFSAPSIFKISEFNSFATAIATVAIFVGFTFLF